MAFSQGNIGKAISLASSENFNAIKAAAVHLLSHVKEMDIHEIVAAVKNVVQYKITINDYLDILSVWFRDVLYFKATRDVDGIIFQCQHQLLRGLGSDPSGYSEGQDPAGRKCEF